MATTYFGVCDSAGNPTGSATDSSGGSAASLWNNTAVLVFTCPGSGAQTVNEITADLNIAASGANMRCAIYSADGLTLIAQGSAAVAVVGTTDTWQGHIGQANITPNPVTLTGGTSYILVVSNSAGGAVGTTHGDGTANSAKFDLIDRTTGFSGALPAGTIASPMWPVRVGVDAASSGVFVPIVGRGPGMALAGNGGGLVSRSRYRSNKLWSISSGGLVVPRRSFDVHRGLVS